MDQNKEIEGGVGQKVVQMKEKKAAAYAKEGKAGRYDTMRNTDGEVVKTETGLTVINTNKKVLFLLFGNHEIVLTKIAKKKVEKIVAHEMNVAKIQVVEGRNLTPKKASKVVWKAGWGKSSILTVSVFRPELRFGSSLKWVQRHFRFVV